jgi:hypothetical protein
LRPLRIVSLTVLYLSAGLVVSLAVAESCSLWSPLKPLYFATRSSDQTTLSWIDDLIETESPALDPDPGPRYERLVHLADPNFTIAKTYMAVQSVATDVGIGLTFEYFHTQFYTSSEAMSSRWLTVRHYKAGWPMACLAGYRAESTTDHTIIRDTTLSAGPLVSKPRFSPPRALLTEPLAFGLAVNATFYAMLLLLSTAGWRWLARHLRRRRNHCPACNYDRKGLATDAPCPECGTGSPKVPVSDA